MVFRRRSNLQPINSTKNVADISSIIAAVTDTVVFTPIITADTRDAQLSDADNVPRGCTINGMYLSLFFITEGGEVANEVPLVDWYIIKDNGGNFGATFDASNLPTPGATGIHENKRFIFHEEKGLAGGGNASLSGVPMVFKGVIRFPRTFKRFRFGDLIRICARTNFATKFCAKAVYKYYT